MKKILYIVTQADWGGAQRYVYDMAISMKQRGYAVCVAAGSPGTLFTKLQEEDIPTYELKKLVREISPAKDYAAYKEIKTLCKEIKPTIVHLNSSKAGMVGAIAARHAEVPKVVYTVHGFAYNEPVAWWKQQLYKTSERLSAPYKDHLICVSHFDLESGIQNNIAKPTKLVAIHNGITALTYYSSEEARLKLELPTTVPIIGCIANFFETKGLRYLLSAVQQIPKTIPFHVAIIGDGELRPALEKQIQELNLTNTVTLLGTVPDAALYLKAFTIYVMPSVKEGFPYALLEAAQAGLPVIATTVGGIPEVIRDTENGLLVESRNVKQLLQAITTLLIDTKAAQQYAQQLKKDFQSSFSLEEMVDKTEAIYNHD